jgi:hypothetical protein
MKIEDFSSLFSEFKRSAFRLETLQTYSVEFEAKALAQYLDGQPLPTVAPNSDWVELVARNLAAGKTMSRVHTLRTPLTPYARFEIEWGYYYSAQAGEEIRLCFVDDAVHQRVGDFWLFDDSIAVRMQYGERGEFIAPALVPQADLSTYLAARDLSVSKSVKLQEYLAAQRRA